jgi:hypothetical protein
MLTARAIAADKAFNMSTCADVRVEGVSTTPSNIRHRPQLIVWRERMRVTGCGHSSILNLYVGRVGGQPPWRMTAGLPGETLAETTLQSSAFPAAVAQARANLPPDCQGSVILNDVYVAARPGGVDVFPPAAVRTHRKGRPSITLPQTATPIFDQLDLSAAWMEIWPFEACGHDRTLAVVFIPRRDQTTSFYLFLPIWRQLAAHGPGGRPAPSP